jgi:hypothetical protein
MRTLLTSPKARLKTFAKLTDMQLCRQSFKTAVNMINTIVGPIPIADRTRAQGEGHALETDAVAGTDKFAETRVITAIIILPLHLVLIGDIEATEVAVARAIATIGTTTTIDAMIAITHTKTATVETITLVTEVIGTCSPIINGPTIIIRAAKGRIIGTLSQRKNNVTTRRDSIIRDVWKTMIIALDQATR